MRKRKAPRGNFSSWRSQDRLHTERLGRLHIMGTPDCRVGICRRNLHLPARVSKSIPEKAAADVRDAVKYVRENADKYHIDKERICLIAYSAGGPLLTLAMRGDMPFVRCLVGFYAFMDIQQSDYRKTEKPETVKAFSPITYLQTDASKIPPMFIARAGRDEVPTMRDSIDRFINEALAKNIALTFANDPQGVHGFDNQNDDERSREIIRAAIEFIRLHLGNENLK
jgi:acetyl esterase/lipase